MKTLLVPIDFSEESENAAHYAVEFAKYADAKVVLLHSYSLPVPIVENVVSEPQYEEMGKLDEELLKTFEAKIRAVNKDIEIEAISSVGFVIEEIRYYAEQKNADAIIMGVTEGGRPMTSFSNTVASAVKEPLCPVFVIPDNVRFQKPTRIAFACDYLSVLPDEVINKLKSIVRLFNAKVLLFDVLKDNELVTYEKAMAEHNLEEAFSDIDYSVYFPMGEDLVKEINSFVDKHLVDMLIMIPHKYSFFSSLFHRSNTRQMALHSHIPLLTIHE